ncbi:MAG: GGDEF domain-containing protein [Lachnospiraceae bacterium]
MTVTAVSDEIKMQMHEIIENKEIKAVFQPIISLKDGTVYAYEALSRITRKECGFHIGEAFEIAEKMNCLWEFEKLCRVNSIEHSLEKPKHAKLFLNVDPNIVNDSSFISGVTRENLKKYDLDCTDIVFEATERSAIRDIVTFQKSLHHYRRQGFSIAVDDVGSGYSGINRIFEIKPQFIKIDMEIIRDIEKDSYKRSFVMALSQFATDSGIALIAEGVETREQLETIISMNIDYAQGYYLAKPSERFESIGEKQKEEILYFQQEHSKPQYAAAFFHPVSKLSTKMPSILPETRFSDVYELMNDPNITELAVVDEQGRFLGDLTKRAVLQELSGMYGYTLNARKSVGEVMDTSCLTVTPDTPIETASKMAMVRCHPYIYDSIAVVDGMTQKYMGFVTIKDLLLAAINIQVKRATDCNPLTGLPGNIAIDEMVEQLMGSCDPFAIIYFDLDNFKAYNDAYGFTNGDLMIKALAEILKRLCRPDDFCGHIGGDDFVVITKGDRTEKLCKSIFEDFTRDSRMLYSEIDRRNGYIMSKNRNGFIEKFSLATLSAAAVTNRTKKFESISELSLAIARTKKEAKQQRGNSLVIT